MAERSVHPAIVDLDAFALPTPDASVVIDLTHAIVAERDLLVTLPEVIADVVDARWVTPGATGEPRRSGVDHLA